MALVLLRCQVVWFTNDFWLSRHMYIGGLMEFGESWENCAARELMEECGIEGGRSILWKWLISLFSEKLVSNICVQFCLWERRETPRGDHHEGRRWRWRGCRKPRTTQVRGLELVFYGRGVCDGKQVSHPWKTLWSLQRETMGFSNSAGFKQ